MDLINSLKLNKFTENKNSKVIISLLIGLYATVAAPALPNNIILFFDTIIGKLLFIFLIAYMASKNIQVAIMLAVAFVTTLTVVNYRKMEHFQQEGFEDNQSCAGYCNTRRQTFEANFTKKYNKEDADFQSKYNNIIGKINEFKEQIKILKKTDIASLDNAKIAFYKTKIVNEEFAIGLLKKYAAAHGKTIDTTSPDNDEDMFTNYEDDNKTEDDDEKKEDDETDGEEEDEEEEDKEDEEEDDDVEEGFVGFLSKVTTPRVKVPVPANDGSGYSPF